MFYFLVLDRELLGTGKRRDEVYEYLRDAIGDSMMSYDIELVGPEITVRSQACASFAETFLSSDVSGEHPSGLHTSNCVSIAVDNSLSPAHTLIQITCQDHKGLLYDIMRTFKDFNIQVFDGFSDSLFICTDSQIIYLHFQLIFTWDSFSRSLFFMTRSHMGVLQPNEEGTVRSTCS